MAGVNCQPYCQWDHADVEDKIMGEIEVGQQPAHVQNLKKTAIVTRRPGPRNIVSLDFLNKYGRESWDNLNQSQPQHGGRLPLKLIHKEFDETFSFFFEVDQTERCQVVLGSDALEEIDASWKRYDDSICIVFASDRKKTKQPDMAESVAVAATRSKQQDQDRADEKKRRQEFRQVASNFSGSGDSDSFKGSKPSVQ